MLPQDEYLDEMSIKLCGLPFDRLPSPNEKARVMELTLLALQGSDIESIKDSIEGMSQRAEEFYGKVVDQLEYYDPIAEWFKKSRLWEGEAHVVP